MTLGGYPPARHILGDLGMVAEVTSESEARMRTRVTPHITGADGGVRAGVLATLVDIVGGAIAARALQPDWMATADLALQVVRPAIGPWVEARGTVVRKGRTTLVIEALVFEVTDDGSDLDAATGDPSPVAWASMTFAVLKARNPASSIQMPTEFPIRWEFVGDGLDTSIVDAVDLSVVDAVGGRVSLPVQEYVSNSFGAVQGGMMALVAEVAGAEALEAAQGSDGASVVVTDLQVVYLAPGRHGPIVTTATVLDAGSRGRHSAVVELVDEGGEGRLATVVNIGATVVDIPAPATS